MERQIGDCQSPEDYALMDTHDLLPIINGGVVSDSERAEIRQTLREHLAFKRNTAPINVPRGPTFAVSKRLIPQFSRSLGRQRPNSIVPLPAISVPLADKRADSHSAADDAGVQDMFDEFINLPSPDDNDSEMLGVRAQSHVPDVQEMNDDNGRVKDPDNQMPDFPSMACPSTLVNAPATPMGGTRVHNSHPVAGIATPVNDPTSTLTDPAVSMMAGRSTPMGGPTIPVADMGIPMAGNQASDFFPMAGPDAPMTSPRFAVEGPATTSQAPEGPAPVPVPHVVNKKGQISHCVGCNKVKMIRGRGRCWNCCNKLREEFCITDGRCVRCGRTPPTSFKPARFCHECLNLVGATGKQTAAKIERAREASGKWSHT